jgi:hypothetical protein
MIKWAAIAVSILAAFLTASVALADTVTLIDGSQLQGKLTGVDAYHIYFAGEAGGEGAIPLAHVRTIVIDWQADPEPRLGQEEWLAAIAKARRELQGCRTAKSGIFLGGLVFIGGGYWLGTLGYGEFGQLIMSLGAIATLLGAVAPAPTCDPPLHRVEILTRIGLEHGWIY